MLQQVDCWQSIATWPGGGAAGWSAPASRYAWPNRRFTVQIKISNLL